MLIKKQPFPKFWHFHANFLCKSTKIHKFVYFFLIFVLKKMRLCCNKISKDQFSLHNSSKNLHAINKTAGRCRKDLHNLVEEICFDAFKRDFAEAGILLRLPELRSQRTSTLMTSDSEIQFWFSAVQYLKKFEQRWFPLKHLWFFVDSGYCSAQLTIFCRTMCNSSLSRHRILFSPFSAEKKWTISKNLFFLPTVEATP